MHLRKAVISALFLFALTIGAKAAEKKPTLVVRIQSINDLVGDMRFLAGEAGQSEMAEQAEDFFKALIAGGKGLEGVDPKKPLGMYAVLGKDFVDSAAILLVPIADQKTLLATMKRQDIEPEKDKNDIYSFYPPGSPVPVFMKFANGYAYAALARGKEALDKDKLLKPADVLTGKKSPAIAMSVNLADIPEEIRDLLKGQLSLQLAALSERLPGEAENVFEVRKKMVEQITEVLNDIIEGAGQFSAAMDVDREAKEVAISTSLGAKADSKMAKYLSSLGKLKSNVAGIFSDTSAMWGGVRMPLPEFYTDAVVKMYKDATKQALDRINDPVATKHAKALLEAMEPLTKTKNVDMAGSFQGPNAKGKYTAVAASHGKNVAGLEKVIRNAMKDKDVPEEIKGLVKLDVAKAGDVNIHSVQIPQEDENATRIFGDTTIYLAFRGDEVFFGMGADAMSVIKSALKAKPAEAKPMHLELSLSRIAPLMETEQEGIAKLAKKIFDKKENKGGDRISVQLTSGKALQMKMSMKTKLLQFFVAMRELRAVQN